MLIVLFTDYGTGSPYVGLMKQAVKPYAPTADVLDLCHDIPAFDAQGGAYLLAAYADELPSESVIIGVVDPGVGSDRAGLIVQADGRFFVGPDNGLFDRVAARASEVRVWHIIWHTARLSATFHGRDIFAPVGAMLAEGTALAEELGDEIDWAAKEWPDDLARIVYIDRYGNAMTGIRARSMGMAKLVVNGQVLNRVRTFSDAAPGEGFWYENSSGLVEIAVNQGAAARYFGLAAGDAVEITGEALTAIRVR